MGAPVGTKNGAKAYPADVSEEALWLIGAWMNILLQAARANAPVPWAEEDADGNLFETIAMEVGDEGLGIRVKLESMPQETLFAAFNGALYQVNFLINGEPVPVDG